MSDGWLSNTYLVAAGAGRRRVPGRRGRPAGAAVRQGRRARTSTSPTSCSPTTTTTTWPSSARRCERWPDARCSPIPSERVPGTTGDLNPGDELEIGGLTVQRAAHARPHGGMLDLLVDGSECSPATRCSRARSAASARPAPRPSPTSSTRSWTCCSRCPAETVIRPGHTDPTTVADELEHNPFVRVWRGLDPEGDEQCTALGEPATLVLWAPTTTAATRPGCAGRTGATTSCPGSRVER